jgi:hypothetical protein
VFSVEVERQQRLHIPYSRDPKDEFERERQETVKGPRAIGRPQTDDEHTDGYARELDKLTSQANADGNTEHSWEYEFLLGQEHNE